MMNVKLSKYAAPLQWGDKATLSVDEGHFVIHVGQKNALAIIQRAARKIESQGIPFIKLAGEGWDVEKQWAFALGFATPKKMDQVSWADDSSEETLKELNARKAAFVWARQTINECPEEIYPESLATKAADFIKSIDPDNVSWNIIKGDELLEQKWIGIHSVGRGSDREPVMLELDYNPTGIENARVDAVLIGKGITFDSGGYSIKSSEGMLSMKSDMGGAGTVTGALGLAIARGLKKRVRLILCCAENLISGNAYKLGDILTYKDGTTVEIVNTDAEGRLVLADGLLRAGEIGAPLIIDAATLTGAAFVALGDHYNALFGFDNELQQRVMGYAAEEGEKTWPLPLERFHQGQCPSAFAITANSRPMKGGGGGGASNAAGFLSRFAPNDGQGWVHIDLAAAYNAHPNASMGAGATGHGIRTIARTLLDE